MSSDPTRRELLRDSAAALAAGGALPLLARPAARRSTRPTRPLRSAVRGEIFSPGDPGYLAAARVFNERYDGVRPRAVLRAADTRDVRDAVAWAVAYGVPLRARSGGHSYAGYSTADRALVIDLRRLRGISLDRRAGIAAPRDRRSRRRQSGRRNTGRGQWPRVPAGRRCQSDAWLC